MLFRSPLTATPDVGRSTGGDNSISIKGDADNRKTPPANPPTTVGESVVSVGGNRYRIV